MEKITVNGAEISPAAMAAEAQHHPSGDPDAALKKAAMALTIRELLRQEADRLSVSAAPECDEDGREESLEEARIRVVLDQEVTLPKADEATCKRYFENNRNRFQTEDLFEASHILFSASPDDKDRYQHAVEKAEHCIKDLQEHPERFAGLAEEESDCPSKSVGGHLGQVTKGQTVPEFETFLFALEEGQLCPVPVKTRFGVHVLRLERKIPGKQLPFDMVKERISSYLEDRAWHTAIAQYVRVLAGRADIRGIDLDGADTPLVQ